MKRLSPRLPPRLPLLASLLAVIVLSSSLAYWFLQLYRAPERPIVAVPSVAAAEPSAEAAATLFGGQAVTVVASNYQLTGVVAAGRQSVAILVADGQPPKALLVGREIASGVTVTEVHPRYVMLSEGGVLKRIDLATDAKAGPELAPPIAQDGAMQGRQLQAAPQVAPAPYQPPPQQTQQIPQQIPQQSPEQQPAPPVQPPPDVQMPAPNRVVNPGGAAPIQ